MRFKDDPGRPMGVMPDQLVVGPKLYWEGTLLLKASQNLGVNTLKGMLLLTTSPYIASPSHWFLLDTKRAAKAASCATSSFTASALGTTRGMATGERPMEMQTEHRLCVTSAVNSEGLPFVSGSLPFPAASTSFTNVLIDKAMP